MRLRGFISGALALPFLGAAPADAAVFCVHAPAGCSGSPAPSVQSAVESAANTSERDRIEVGPGRFAESFIVLRENVVDIIGAGAGQTVLELPGNIGARVDEPASTVQALRIEGERTGLSGPALRLVGRGEGIAVRGREAGVALVGSAVLTLSDVSASGPAVTTEQEFGAGLLDRTAARSDEGFAVLAGSPLTVQHARIGGRKGIFSRGTAVTVTNTSIVLDIGLTAPTGPGLLAETTGGADAKLEAFNVTVSCPRGDRGLWSSGAHAGRTATLSAFNTAVYCGVALVREAVSGSAANLSVRRSAYDDRRSSNGAGTLSEVQSLPGADPRFASLGGDSRRPTGGSPLIDAGEEGVYTDVPATDVAGAPRLVDGDGRNGAAIDIGAFEYQRNAPIAVLTAATKDALPGEEIAFDAGASSDPDGEPLRVAIDFDDGTRAFTAGPLGLPGSGASTTHAFARAGTYKVGLTVTDTSNAADADSVTVRVRDLLTISPAATALTRTGVLRFLVACHEDAEGGCEGTLAGTTRSKLRADTRSAAQRIDLGSQRFDLAPGRSAQLTFALTRDERRAFSRRTRIVLALRADYEALGRSRAATLRPTVTLSRSLRVALGR